MAVAVAVAVAVARLAVLVTVVPVVAAAVVAILATRVVEVEGVVAEEEVARVMVPATDVVAAADLLSDLLLIAATVATRTRTATWRM